MIVPVKSSFFSKIPFPFWVIGFLLGGSGVGVALPRGATTHVLYIVGTYFPHTVHTQITALCGDS